MGIDPYDVKRVALRRKDGDGHGSKRAEERWKAYSNMVGWSEGWTNIVSRRTIIAMQIIS